MTETQAPQFKLGKQLLFGLATFVPVLGIRPAAPGGDTQSSRYCYSVWLRHLVMAHRSGLNTNPEIVSELGPGNSLGIGLAALICGADYCYALDVESHTEISANVAVFDELCELFSKRTPIPDDDEFPAMKPRIDNYAFPAEILSEDRLVKVLSPNRLTGIRQALINPGENSPIQYQAPWDDPRIIRPHCVDMIFSQAVLEHVDDLQTTYAAMVRWLKPDGFVSHQIDFKCHGWANEWNGHWRYPELVWRILRGKRTFAINRQPHSQHVAALQANGFELKCDQTTTMASSYKISDLAPMFRFMSEQDLVTSGAFIQAVRQ